MRSMLGLKAPASGSELRARGYEAGARMGSGQFGYAVLVTKACPSGAPESRTYVAKLQKFRHLPSEDKERMQREVDAMRTLAEAGHPYLVRFRESFVEGDKLCIIMDYCDSGDLAVRIKRQREVGHGQQFPEAQVQRWLAQLIAGLDFLHAMHVLHRDIKPSSERLPPPGYPCARVRGERPPHPSPRRRRARRSLPPPGQRAQDRRPRAVEADPGGHRRRAEAHAVRLSRVPRARGAHVPGVRRQGRHLGGGLHAVRGDDAPPRLHRRRHGGDPRQSRLRGARSPCRRRRHREAAADPAAPPPPPQQHGPIFGDWTAELEELLLAMLRMRTKERPTARELLTSAHLAPAVATIDPQALAHVVRAAPPPPPPTRRVVVARRVG